VSCARARLSRWRKLSAEMPQTAAASVGEKPAFATSSKASRDREGSDAMAHSTRRSSSLAAVSSNGDARVRANRGRGVAPTDHVALRCPGSAARINHVNLPPSPPRGVPGSENGRYVANPSYSRLSRPIECTPRRRRSGSRRGTGAVRSSCCSSTSRASAMGSAPRPHDACHSIGPHEALRIERIGDHHSRAVRGYSE